MLDRRRFIFLGTACIGLSALAGTEAVEEASFLSPVLGRPLPYLVHPVGNPGRGAPLVYLLHGHGGSEWDWLRAGGAIEATEALLASGQLPPLYLVLPGTGNSWYVDAPPLHGAAIATALLDGLMPTVEAELDCDTRSIGIIGLSMGGFGALHLGLKRPERFRFIGALSPSLCPPGSAITDRQIEVFGGAFGQPFDQARYAAADPFGMVAGLATADIRPAIHLACGAEDDLGLAIGTRAFAQRLDEAGIPAAVRIVPGRHDWPFWHAELPHALAAFGKTLRLV